MNTRSGNTKTLWRLAIAIVAILSLYFIWVRVSGRVSSDSFPQLIADAANRPGSTGLLALVLGMMLLNWGLESWKWMLLVKPFCNITFPLAFRAVMSGTTVSLFTPNRIGEFAGRVLHLPPGERAKGIVATITGSMSQLLVTILAGCTAVLWMPDDPSVSSAMNHETLILLASLIPVAAALAFLALPGLIRVLPHGRFSRYFQPLEEYSPLQLIVAVLLSSLRYLVFSVQFFLTLDLFGIQLPFMEALRLIAVIYLVLTGVPTIAFSEIAVRGSVALFFLAPYSSDTLSILAASTLVWVINLALPAVLGAFAAFWIRINR